MEFRYAKRFTGSKRMPSHSTVLQYSDVEEIAGKNIKVWKDMPSPDNAVWENPEDEVKFANASRSYNDRHPEDFYVHGH